jgi:hypothetical protein
MTKTSIFRFSAVERNISDDDLILRFKPLGRPSMDQTGQEHDSIQLFSNISKVNLYSNSHLLEKAKGYKCLTVANFQPRKVLSILYRNDPLALRVLKQT